jgi:hypothetical protein
LITDPVEWFAEMDRLRGDISFQTSGTNREHRVARFSE